MKTLEADVAIVGAGTAGLNARREVERAGKRPVLIESGPYGTTCARVGCMPSKLLIAAADIAHEVYGAHRFGIDVQDSWRVNGEAVLDRVRRERDRFAGFVVESTEALPDEQRLCGHARFVAPTVLEVDDHTRVEAKAIVIATGSSPVVPPPFDALDRHLLVNDDVFELRDLPDSLAVIGTGIIGLELGQALSRLGVRVAFFNPREKLGLFTDPVVSRKARAVLCKELDIRLKSEVLAASADADGVTIQWRDAAGEEREEGFAKVLAAAGRRPNLAGLDFEHTSLQFDERGQPPWDPRTTQCGDAPIFMAGDVSGHIPLLHEAADEGRIAGANAAAFPEVTAHVRREPLAIAFTAPQMAIVGTPHAGLDRDDVEVGEVSFDDQGRARVMGQNQGVMRIYARRESCTLLGAELFGPRVEHLAHLLAWSIQQDMSVLRALEMPFYHPVVEEALRTGLRDLADKLKVTGNCRCEDLAEVPGS
ncbi:MAG: dihydrolipoyl dehydrogenase [Myxococcota bacterium]